MKYLGIDGCKGGWFLVGLNQDMSGAFTVLDSIQGLSGYLDEAELALIDAPIGLRGRSLDERLCDKAARRLLGSPRASCVFPAPSRYVLECMSYEEASAKNRECTGRGLSRQSWAIVPKIREVDRFLQQEGLRYKIREMHPEICFWALNNHCCAQENKKRRVGYEQRVAILERFHPDARRVIDLALDQYPRKVLARDDVVDALAGAVTASLPGMLCMVPDVPETDEIGLPMEMVYRGRAAEGDGSF